VENLSHILLCDETNKEATEKSRFFIYGGLFVPIAAIGTLHDAVEEIRQEYGFRPDDLLKFSPRDKPNHVSLEAHKLAKQAILERAAGLGIACVFSLTHHQVAKNRSLDELVGWGANTIFGAFNEYLSFHGGSGMAVTDRLPFVKDFSFLREKFQIGLSFPSGRTKRLSRIALFASSCEGASNLLSVNDVVLGSFRYCINELDKTIAPKEIMSKLVRLIWHKVISGKLYLNEFGLRFRPRAVNMALYKKDYDEVEDHLRSLMTET
jgi:hypothetical protein